jgi:hypothetical protein
MVPDSEIDCAYAQRWTVRVTATTCDGREHEKLIASPKRDPDNTLTRPALDDKVSRLATCSGGARDEEMAPLIARIWRLREMRAVEKLINKTICYIILKRINIMSHKILRNIRKSVVDCAGLHRRCCA